MCTFRKTYTVKYDYRIKYHTQLDGISEEYILLQHPKHSTHLHKNTKPRVSPTCHTNFNSKQQFHQHAGGVPVKNSVLAWGVPKFSFAGGIVVVVVVVVSKHKVLPACRSMLEFSNAEGMWLTESNCGGSVQWTFQKIPRIFSSCKYQFHFHNPHIIIYHHL